MRLLEPNAYNIYMVGLGLLQMVLELIPDSRVGVQSVWPRRMCLFIQFHNPMGYVEDVCMRVCHIPHWIGKKVFGINLVDTFKVVRPFGLKKDKSTLSGQVITISLFP